MPAANPSPNMNYIKSERFIHDQLLERCDKLVEVAKTVWIGKQGDPSIVFIWPSEPIEAEDGSLIEDEILAELPQEDKAARLRKLVDMTKAYGLLVIELQPHALVAIFESPHGAKSWITRRELRGDVRVLAETEEHLNREHYGLLWSAKQGTA